MSTVPFYKMTGSGNDFVIVEGRSSAVADWPERRIQAICDRRRGVGADGLVLVHPEGGGAARMVYFNADGSRGGMCGNAALCSTRLVDRLGMAPGAGMDLHTDTGILRTRTVGPGWAAELQLPNFRVPAPVALPLLAGERWMMACTVGVPHLVLLVEDLGSVNVVERGRALRFDPAFGPAGVNVNFVSRVEGGNGEATWRLRTYERGVEDETLACATGTVGTAFSLVSKGLARLPIRIASWGGNVYSVAGRLEEDQAIEPWLSGEGRLVFQGEWADRE